MTNRAFFYGTLMTGFDRRRRIGIDQSLRYVGRGCIQAALFDLGIYPAAVPDPEGRVWGELYEMANPQDVLSALDSIEAYRPDEPDASLYIRREAPVMLEDGALDTAWVYFYNAPLGRAERIQSGDYLAHLKVK